MNSKQGERKFVSIYTLINLRESCNYFLCVAVSRFQRNHGQVRIINNDVHICVFIDA